jgi:hypothetical protein
MRLASWILRELIPLPFVWLDPGITPMLQKSKIDQPQKNLAKVDFGKSPRLHHFSAPPGRSVVDFG